MTDKNEGRIIKLGWSQGLQQKGMDNNFEALSDVKNMEYRGEQLVQRQGSLALGSELSVHKWLFFRSLKISGVEMLMGISAMNLGLYGFIKTRPEEELVIWANHVSVPQHIRFASLNGDITSRGRFPAGVDFHYIDNATDHIIISSTGIVWKLKKSGSWRYEEVPGTPVRRVYIDATYAVHEKAFDILHYDQYSGNIQKVKGDVSYASINEEGVISEVSSVNFNIDNERVIFGRVPFVPIGEYEPTFDAWGLPIHASGMFFGTKPGSSVPLVYEFYDREEDPILSSNPLLFKYNAVGNNDEMAGTHNGGASLRVFGEDFPYLDLSPIMPLAANLGASMGDPVTVGGTDYDLWSFPLVNQDPTRFPDPVTRDTMNTYSYGLDDSLHSVGRRVAIFQVLVPGAQAAVSGTRVKYYAAVEDVEYGDSVNKTLHCFFSNLPHAANFRLLPETLSVATGPRWLSINTGETLSLMDQWSQQKINFMAGEGFTPVSPRKNIHFSVLNQWFEDSDARGLLVGGRYQLYHEDGGETTSFSQYLPSFLPNVGEDVGPGGTGLSGLREIDGWELGALFEGGSWYHGHGCEFSMVNGRFEWGNDEQPYAFRVLMGIIPLGTKGSFSSGTQVFGQPRFAYNPPGSGFMVSGTMLFNLPATIRSPQGTVPVGNMGYNTWDIAQPLPPVAFGGTILTDYRSYPDMSVKIHRSSFQRAFVFDATPEGFPSSFLPTSVYVPPTAVIGAGDFMFSRHLSNWGVVHKDSKRLLGSGQRCYSGQELEVNPITYINAPVGRHYYFPLIVPEFREYAPTIGDVEITALMRGTGLTGVAVAGHRVYASTRDQVYQLDGMLRINRVVEGIPGTTVMLFSVNKYIVGITERVIYTIDENNEVSIIRNIDRPIKGATALSGAFVVTNSQVLYIFPEFQEGFVIVRVTDLKVPIKDIDFTDQCVCAGNFEKIWVAEDNQIFEFKEGKWTTFVLNDNLFVDAVAQYEGSLAVSCLNKNDLNVIWLYPETPATETFDPIIEM